MLIFHWIAEVIHNSRYWAYNTKSWSRRNVFLGVMEQFLSLEQEMADVYFGVGNERVSLLNHDIKTFKFSHDFFSKLPHRVQRTEYPEEMQLLIDKFNTLCYQSHARLSMK